MNCSSALKRDRKIAWTEFSNHLNGSFLQRIKPPETDPESSIEFGAVVLILKKACSTTIDLL